MTTVIVNNFTSNNYEITLAGENNLAQTGQQVFLSDKDLSTGNFNSSVTNLAILDFESSCLTPGPILQQNDAGSYSNTIIFTLNYLPYTLNPSSTASKVYELNIFEADICNLIPFDNHIYGLATLYEFIDQNRYLSTTSTYVYFKLLKFISILTTINTSNCKISNQILDLTTNTKFSLSGLTLNKKTINYISDLSLDLDSLILSGISLLNDPIFSQIYTDINSIPSSSTCSGSSSSLVSTFIDMGVNIQGIKSANLMVPLYQLTYCFYYCFPAQTGADCTNSCSTSQIKSYIQSYMSYSSWDAPTNLLREYLMAPISLSSSEKIVDLDANGLQTYLSDANQMKELSSLIQKIFDYYKNGSSYNINLDISTYPSGYDFSISDDDCTGNGDGNSCCSHINTICKNNKSCIYPEAGDNANWCC
jgi:hypothetical protein